MTVLVTFAIECALRWSRSCAADRKLRIRSEQAFAEAKIWNGTDRAGGNGRERVQAELVGTVQNLNLLAALPGRERR